MSIFPFSLTTPAEIDSKPTKHLKLVLFPAPLTPSNVKTSPFFTPKEVPLTASDPLGAFLSSAG